MDKIKTLQTLIKSFTGIYCSGFWLKICQTLRLYDAISVLFLLRMLSTGLVIQELPLGLMTAFKIWWTFG